MPVERRTPPQGTLETPPPDPRERADGLAARVAQAAELAAHGKPEAAYELIERELAHEGGRYPVGARANLLTEASVILWLLGRYDESEARARRAVALAELDGNPALAADALLRLGLALHRRGRLEDARDAYVEARARFRRLGDAGKAGAAANNLGLVCKDRGEWDAARAHFEEAVDAARRGSAEPRTIGTRLQNLAVLELKSGRWAAAKDTLEQARAALEESGDQRGRATNAIARGMLARLERRYDDAAALAKRALEIALGERLLREEALAHELLGDIALDDGDPRRARSHFDRAWRIAERIAPASDLASETLRRLAEVALAEGDVTRARGLIERVRKVAAALGDPYEYALVERLEAEALLAAGQAEAGMSLLEGVAGKLSALGERFECGRTLLRAAACAAPDEAVRLEFRAGACFAEVGAEAESQETHASIARRLAGAEAPVRRSAPASPRKSVRGALIGPSRALARLRVHVSRLARQEYPVLLRGEHGTGRDLVARLLHERSERAAFPFLVVRCADLNEAQLTAHLFGDARAALPARERVPAGVLERADGGTLYLDELPTLPFSVQTALLRFVMRRIFFRLGELEPRTANVRIVASWTERLADAAALRPELLARFAKGTIALPALRERPDDIVPLARAFLLASGAAAETKLSTEAANLLLTHPWFGNVTELRECIEQVLVHAGPETALIGPELIAPMLETGDPPAPANGAAPDPQESTLLHARLLELERQRILRSLSRAHGNKTRAARELKIARKTLYERMRRLGIGGH